ncbi:ubiquitin carboxyl-terminal hydrolase 2-like [Bidens hawaiensis]|uniref:ubiquitin carboxyl-terminal hydrolase 2-like n=1 Tax=Bidens hawaiensis TaxID=980011 RepID=UPI00404B78DF
MGKKVKKRAARAEKEKRLQTSSPKTVLPEIVPATDVDAVIDGVSVNKETQTCPHLEDGIDFEKFSLKLSSLESHKCDDCRDSAGYKRAKKGKSKHGKGKANGSKPESISIWVCLECGHFSCGGAGLPTTPHSHAARHSKQNRHPLVIQFSNPNLRWCFPCSKLIPVHGFENEEQKDGLSEFVKLFKNQSSSSETRVDVEDIWFGGGSVTSEIKSVSTLTSSVENGDRYMIRGLVNLGNTCFFNSVLQNLLSMDVLRDYFMKLERPVGPLTSSLKKLFVETSPSTGVRNVINPRSFFGCVCAKAPQFKGFQQHDSHELLRCLLDGLCTEESRVQKRSQDDKSSPKHVSTFVDNIFGGQISSTVSCLECGHASVVYEPCLDLSLPLPTKNSQSKRATTVSRSKKPKLPPKRQGKFRPKSKKVTNVSTSNESAQPINPIEKETDNNIDSGDLKQPELQENGIKRDNNDSGTVNPSDASSLLDHSEPTVVSNGHDTAVDHVDSVDSEEPLSWLDYLEPSSSMVDNMESHYQDSSVIQDSVQDSGNSNDAIEDSGNSNDAIQVSRNSNDAIQVSENSNDVVWEDEPLLQVQESEVLLLPYKEVTSTSEQEPLDFDGFGGLFDEPEVADGPGPTVNPLPNGIEESESDPDEVDTDSPVSVEKCLAYFTTPELLTKTEHAWQCEKCSKSLKTRLKSKVQNGGENGISSVSSDSCIDHVVSNGVKNFSDQSTENADVVLGNGKSDDGQSQDAESFSVNGNEKVLERQDEPDSSEDEEVDSKCVMARDASKRILISRAPPVLTIHLKRFCQDARGRLSKLNGHVNFRDTIDLKPYMDPSCCKDKETYKYQLVGVVEHSGTMRGGHYVAYVKGVAKGNLDNSLWYHASDAYVREASLEEVLGCEAYILFYEEM